MTRQCVVCTCHFNSNTSLIGTPSVLRWRGSTISYTLPAFPVEAEIHVRVCVVANKCIDASMYTYMCMCVTFVCCLASVLDIHV